MRFLVLLVGLLAAMAQVASAASVAVLQYHHISDDTPRVTSVTAAELDAHITWLKKNGFEILSVADVADALYRSDDYETKLSEFTAVITIDDGWRNVYEQGLAVFKKHNVPFTIFVNPKLMREAPHLYMNWEQLRELQQWGATIANHANSHLHMTWRKGNETERQWRLRMRKEIVEAQRDIEAELGVQDKVFAYPYGEFDEALMEILEDEGYLAFAQHSGPWNEYSPRTAIPRFPASGQYANLATLATKMKSLALPVVGTDPITMVMDHDQRFPRFTVTLEHTEDFHPHQMNCFYRSKIVQPDWDGKTFSVAVPAALPIGRSRVNCTAPSKTSSGRFYWYSQPFVRPDATGRWPD